MTSRRGFLFGASALAVTAPAIVRAASLMPVKLIDFDLPLYGISPAMEILSPSIAELQDRVRAAHYGDLYRIINPPVIFGDGEVRWFRSIPIRIVERLDD